MYSRKKQQIVTKKKEEKGATNINCLNQTGNQICIQDVSGASILHIVK